ncbi:A24 family peptidase [Pseudoduganella umbonata]|uniref:Prepilin peptidase n=1 Tax=Pseudoduganella umbonata TaxID=864828 RepID=A0A4P8HWG2_9BURK|nr:prepilin peptidase [Pseudoduganella umbonata]MBB3223784.1 prepilin peptidase CpaA [Pseudoduganella umbonata]QCP12794.1 prepilin peptidase [Pseudoduganella umbonata]
MNQALQILLLWLVLQAAVTDLALRRIPNALVVSGLVLSLLLHWRTGAEGVLLSTWLAGLAAGFFLFLPLYLLRGMAAGDVKLMAMTGAFVGPALAMRIGILTCLIGGILAVGMLVMNGRWRILFRNLKSLMWPLLCRVAGFPMQAVVIDRQASAGGIPYGVAIALGTTAVVLEQHGFAFA